MSKRFAIAAIVTLLSTAAAFTGTYTARLTSDSPDPPASIERVTTMEGYASRYHPAHISSKEAWDLVISDDEALVLDIRSEASYDENHVSGAINVPFEDLADYAAANITDKDRTIICYCFCDDKGGPALSAYNLLTVLGYTNVFYMDPDSEWTYACT